jgi:hypothetical protein
MHCALRLDVDVAKAGEIISRSLHASKGFLRSLQQGFEMIRE